MFSVKRFSEKLITNNNYTCIVFTEHHITQHKKQESESAIDLSVKWTENNAKQVESDREKPLLSHTKLAFVQCFNLKHSNILTNDLWF